jgi:hypothetical protein
LGGFSAYLTVPSGRCWNQPGCSFSHGWSGEHWIAKSSAISSPCSFAAATRRSKSASVPSSGWIASWPPSSAPIAHGLPGSSGEAAERAREQLVPGAETAELPVDVELERRRADGAVPVGDGRGERRLDVEVLDPEQQRALGQLAVEVLLAGLDLSPELVAEGGGAVAPGLDQELPATRLGHLERAGEEVVPEQLERRRGVARARRGRRSP